jgi:hypothetical protein
MYAPNDILDPQKIFNNPVKYKIMISHILKKQIPDSNNKPYRKYLKDVLKILNTIDTNNMDDTNNIDDNKANDINLNNDTEESLENSNDENNIICEPEIICDPSAICEPNITVIKNNSA